MVNGTYLSWLGVKLESYDTYQRKSSALFASWDEWPCINLKRVLLPYNWDGEELVQLIPPAFQSTAWYEKERKRKKERNRHTETKTDRLTVGHFNCIGAGQTYILTRDRWIAKHEYRQANCKADIETDNSDRQEICQADINTDNSERQANCQADIDTDNFR